MGVLADRAYDVPPVIDRLTASGWDWIIRVKARSTLVWRGADGSEQPLRTLVSAALSGPGTRLRASGQSFKKAGWRAVQLVGEWAHGYAEPLVVLTRLPARWSVLSRYARRFWIEAAFRQDKSAGWEWQHSQLRDPRHQERLLLALAWVTTLILSLGAHEAPAALVQAGRRGMPTAPRHPRDRLCTLGLAGFRARLYGTQRGPLRWRLPRLGAPSWCADWLARQQPHPQAQSVLP